VSAAGPPRPRRLLLFLVGAVAWTLLSSYPNPAVLYRNLARYRRFPLDPEVEARMGWDLPDSPAAVEAFVDSYLAPWPDWPLYRVPWYVPTALEAARAGRGDCEAKAFLLASLLEGKGIPFEIRASLNHIWVHYEGRRPREGERRELAYIEGQPGRLRVRWPQELDWREVLAIQRRHLWDAMPLARKAIWLLGLAWLAAVLAALGTPRAQGDVASDWRPPLRPYAGRALFLAVLFLALIAVAPSLRRSTPARWTLADAYEAAALSLLVGACLTWAGLPHRRLGTSVREGGAGLEVTSALGPWVRRREVRADDIAHLELEASPGGLRPWTLAAALRSGERAPLALRRGEVEARRLLRHLGLALNRPVVVRSGDAEYRAMPDEIALNLRARAQRRPPAQPPGDPPPGCDLRVEGEPGRWAVGYPGPDRGGRWALVGLAAFPVAVAGLATACLLVAPRVLLFWAGWIVAMALLSFTVYLALVLRGELLSRLSGAGVEVAEEGVRYRDSEGRTEQVPLEQVESVELGRQGEAPTIAIVSPERVLHVRGLCDPMHLPWLRRAIEHAVCTVGPQQPDR